MYLCSLRMVAYILWRVVQCRCRWLHIRWLCWFTSFTINKWVVRIPIALNWRDLGRNSTCIGLSNYNTSSEFFPCLNSKQKVWLYGIPNCSMPPCIALSFPGWLKIGFDFCSVTSPIPWPCACGGLKQNHLRY